MDPGQFAQQIKHILGACTWPDGCPVFGEESVYVVAGAPAAPPKRFPWALVSVGSGDFDEEDPGILRQNFSVWAGVHIPGDDMGEHAIIGGALDANNDTHAGRGLLEVDVEIRRAIGKMTGADGCHVQLSSTSTPSTELLEDNTQLAFSELNLLAACTALPSYTSPTRLNRTAGVWTWQGGPCEARFDFVEYVLVDSAGPGPAASPSDGTVVYTGTARTTIEAVSGVGTVFAGYGSRGVTEAYSRPLRGSWV